MAPTENYTVKYADSVYRTTVRTENRGLQYSAPGTTATSMFESVHRIETVQYVVRTYTSVLS